MKNKKRAKQPQKNTTKINNESNIISNNNNPPHIESSPSNIESLVTNSNQINKNNNINNINTTTKENTIISSIVQPYSKKIKKSPSSNNSNSNLINTNLNIIQDNQNLEPNLEPIMEAPPLEKIIKREDLYEFYINDPDKNTTELFFKNNKISTTKYNAITFLPKALLYQFIRLANIYFVFIAILQSIPLISPLGAATAIAPLVFVLAVSLIREAVEDLKRRKLDNEQNSNEAET